jgi:hypothetical protein
MMLLLSSSFNRLWKAVSRCLTSEKSLKVSKEMLNFSYFSDSEGLSAENISI